MKPTIERLQTQLAGLQAQIAYAQQERDAALKASAAAQERETATADILRLINESPADLERIMPEIGRAVERLCEADHGVIGFEVKGADGRPTFHNWDAIRGLRVFEQGVSRFVLSAADEMRGYTHVVGRIEDWEAEYPGLVGITRADGLTELALLSVPLMSGKSRIGYMLARRNTARAFDAHHITLLQHLAAQAVVAVENARAFNELQARNREVAQALEQQTATADILDVISRSPSNLQAALDAVVLNATRLLESEGAVVVRFMPDGSAGWVAVANGSEIAPGPRLATPAPTPADAGSEAMAILSKRPHGDAPWRPRQRRRRCAEPRRGVARARRERVHRHAAADHARPLRRIGGHARVTGTLHRCADPAARDLRIAGRHRHRKCRAVQRTATRNKEITDALNEQTAMAEVLGIIAASPDSLEKPLQAIVESATRLCEGTFGNLWLLEGDDAVLAAQCGRKEDGMLDAGFRMPAASNSYLQLALRGRTRNVQSLYDLEPNEVPAETIARQIARLGDRSMVLVPLQARDVQIGMLAITRKSVLPFSERNVELVSTFANQAVIAIENARLLRELRERNADVSAALEQQKALADVLEVIANSATDARPVLEAILETGSRLCTADGAAHSWSMPMAHTCTWKLHAVR